ncbi:MAG: hypothetical protein FWE31_01640 [Firmicutes bacterium]|nr:hypothetical protein [Bacillota bacterium]
MKVEVRDGEVACSNVRMYFAQESLRDRFAEEGEIVAVEEYDPFKVGGKRFGKPGTMVDLDEAFEQCKKCQTNVFFKDTAKKKDCLIYNKMKRQGRMQEQKIQAPRKTMGDKVADWVVGDISFD